MPDNRINFDITDGKVDDLYLAGVSVHIERLSGKGYSIQVVGGDKIIHLVAQGVRLGCRSCSVVIALDGRPLYCVACGQPIRQASKNADHEAPA